MMEFREMMLPYIVTANGQTIGQRILPHLEKAIESRPERLLMSPKDSEEGLRGHKIP